MVGWFLKQLFWNYSYYWVAVTYKSKQNMILAIRQSISNLQPGQLIEFYDKGG
ncbi:hypothetical protein FHW36_1011318 [Chitinophaga polysaccharea]|uniref:Uncharacterized protein n=1 Tax=Chitinophaga polysaccharea TaxID=1293035 RepID=A0A561Q4V6_9BACT|nr:hypothetical protein FHW36_1011318 [Chitinophaga polysaccharea]